MYAHQTKLNGGLYTGEPFKKDAPWATVPVIPDADYMTHYNLRSANPPPEALTQYPGGTRPGNNFQTMPGVIKSSGMYCNKTACANDNMEGYSKPSIIGSFASTS